MIFNSILFGLIALILIHVLNGYHPLLSHVLSELFAISVAWALFMVVWNARSQIDNDAFVFLGIALLFIGFIDLMHALVCKKIGFVEIQGESNPAVQLWVAARGLQSLTFAAFPLLLGRRLDPRPVMAGFALVTAMILLSVFYWKVFPPCFIDHVGGTPIKRLLETVFTIILLAALWLLHARRQSLDPQMHILMMGAVGLMVATELRSLFFSNPERGISLISHYLKLFSFFLVYLALVRSGLQRPYAVLFRKLQASVRAVTDAHIERTTILDHQPDHIILHDLEQQILWVNKTVCDFVGRPREELIGKRCTEIWKQAFAVCRRCPMGKTIRTGQIENVTTETPDGVSWKIRFCPVFDADGGIASVLEIRENITERIKAVDSLRYSEEKFSKAFHLNSTLMSISSIDDGIFDEVNEAFLRSTGLLPEAVIGRSSIEMGVISRQDREKMLSLLDELGRVENLPLELMPGSRNPRQCICSFEIITIRGQNKLLGMCQDVTDMVRMRRELDQERSLADLIESQRTLQTILDGIPDIIGLQKTDHSIIAFNKAGYAALGKAPAEVHGKKCFELFGHRQPCDHCATVRALESGKIETFERFEPTLNRWYKINTIPIKDSAGKISMLVEQIREITADRNREVELRRLGSAIQQVAEEVVITDVAGIIEYVNPAFEQITGYGQEEAIGKNPRILKSGQHDEEFYNALWGTISSGKTWHGRMINRKKDGSVYHEEASISPVFDKGGKIVNYVAVKRDITEQLDLEAHLRQAQKMEAIGTLAGGIAHDFNNILFPMMGFAEILREDLPETSPLQEHVDEILKASTRARDLVQQILAFSRQAKQEKKAIRIQTIVKEAIKLCRASLPSTITFDVKVDNECPAVVADPTQIHQVAMNLITNAFHAMEETGGTLAVAVRKVRRDAAENGAETLPAGTYVCLSVADTGCGIDPAIRDKIFMPYFTTKGQNKGTGMGLAVVLGIVQSHGGDVHLSSVPGEGTQIRACFPCEAREATEDTGRRQAPLPRGDERILLVDDEPAITRMLRQRLERIGYTVSERTSSVEALQVFRARPDAFDLVISDLTMPGMTGTRLAAEIKKRRPNTPVILCTGYSERFNQSNLSAMGIEGFVLKPVVIHDLANEIRRVLDRPPAVLRQVNSGNAPV
ncbi:hypothetical protein DSCOOX_47490 [Desulfosarcina ovata subsp. ovata]|uniref:histidine kinase n=2 Tax=Desulfosarcina ovata TaxID=83564 RepID=A0A5K8AGD5_9BACT|nr:hypothetical protein DSCOOX_47490 [Desulfosarcina ovata subsp. ovata]